MFGRSLYAPVESLYVTLYSILRMVKIKGGKKLKKYKWGSEVIPP